MDSPRNAARTAPRAEEKPTEPSLLRYHEDDDDAPSSRGPRDPDGDLGLGRLMQRCAARTEELMDRNEELAKGGGGKEELVDGMATGSVSHAEHTQGGAGMTPFEYREFLLRRYGGASAGEVVADRGPDLPPRCRPKSSRVSRSLRTASALGLRTDHLLEKYRASVAEKPSEAEEGDTKSEGGGRSAAFLPPLFTGSGSGEEEDAKFEGGGGFAVPEPSSAVLRDPPEVWLEQWDHQDEEVSEGIPTGNRGVATLGRGWDQEPNFFMATAGRREVNLRRRDDGSDCGSDSKEAREGSRRATRLAVWVQKHKKFAAALCAAVATLTAFLLGAVVGRGTEGPYGSKASFRGIADLQGPVWRAPAGRTHDEAAALCAADGRALCDVAAVCPRGPGSRPALPPGGPAGAGLAWVPVRDGGRPNAWLQVGDRDFCLTYDYVHGVPPAWGLTGENDYVTRRLVCCPAGAGEEEEGEEEAPAPAPAPAPPAPSRPGVSDGVWYGPLDGWDGRTIGDARRFCADADPSSFPCPYETYCPGGPRRALAEEGGAGDGTAVSWVPVVDEVGPGMVRVGVGGNDDASGEDLCRVRRDFDDPQGAAEREVTHIMCCRLVV